MTVAECNQKVLEAIEGGCKCYRTILKRCRPMTDYMVDTTLTRLMRMGLVGRDENMDYVPMERV